MTKIFLILIIQLFSTPLAFSSTDNPVILQGFYWYIPDEGTNLSDNESNLWQFIANQKAKEIAADGFTHMWLPPMSKAYSPDSSYNVGYAVYDHYDLGEFDQMGRVRTKYGTKKELHNAVNALHSRGVKVIADIVMNHKLGAAKKTRIYARHAFSGQKHRPARYLGAKWVDAYITFDHNNKFDARPRGNKYSTFIWRPEHFDGMENYGNYYIFEGKTPDKVGNFGDLDFLPNHWSDYYQGLRSDIILGSDIDYEHADTRAEMIRWTKWLVKEVGVDGFRVDAIRHIHTPFIKEWAIKIKKFMRSIGKGENNGLLMFGESWDGWTERLKSYLEGRPENTDLNYSAGEGPRNYCGIDNSMSLFDVPLHYVFRKIAKKNFSSPQVRMKDLPNHGLISERPDKAITFVDNHDTVPTQELASYIPVHTKIQAYTYILLNEFGTPTVYYRDLYKGNFVSDYYNDNFYYLNGSIKNLLKIRKKYAYGKGQYFSETSKPGILGYKRLGSSNKHKSGLIYMIREFDSKDNGLAIPTDGKKWQIAGGCGNINNGRFWINDECHYAIWVQK